VPAHVAQTRRGQRLHHPFGRNAGLDRVPVVAPQFGCIALAADHAGDQRHHGAHVALEQRRCDASLGLGDLENRHAPAGAQHAMELGEGGGHVADVAHGVAHADEIAARVGSGQGFGHAAHQLDAGQPDLAQHAGAGVDADEVPGGADQLQRLARHQPGADAHVEHLHARRESCLLQHRTAVRGAGAQRQHAFDAVVVGRGAVEDALQERLVLRLVAVVQRQGRVRRQGVGIPGPDGRRWRHRTIITKSPDLKSGLQDRRCVRRTVNSGLLGLTQKHRTAR